MGDIQPSKPRPALRGVEFPVDSIPRIPVVHQQPAATTSADTGLRLDPHLHQTGSAPMAATGSVGPSTTKQPYVPPFELGQKPPVGNRLDLVRRKDGS